MSATESFVHELDEKVKICNFDLSFDLLFDQFKPCPSEGIVIVLFLKNCHVY